VTEKASFITLMRVRSVGTVERYDETHFTSTDNSTLNFLKFNFEIFHSVMPPKWNVKSLWSSIISATTLNITILALLQKFCSCKTFLGHLFLISNTFHSAFTLAKNSLLFNFLYLIKHFNQSNTLCIIITIVCLKINQYSTGLFVSYSVKNPIAWKNV
jgi:hypothetical protein